MTTSTASPRPSASSAPLTGAFVSFSSGPSAPLSPEASASMSGAAEESPFGLSLFSGRTILLFGMIPSALIPLRTSRSNTISSRSFFVSDRWSQSELTTIKLPPRYHPAGPAQIPYFPVELSSDAESARSMTSSAEINLPKQGLSPCEKYPCSIKSSDCSVHSRSAVSIFTPPVSVSQSPLTPTANASNEFVQSGSMAKPFSLALAATSANASQSATAFCTTSGSSLPSTLAAASLSYMNTPGDIP